VTGREAALALPFAVDARGRAAVKSGDDHLRDMIRLVLFTAPGERVNRPEFGCGIRQLVFAPNSDVLAAATQQLVHGALQRWLEPVIAVEGVTVRADEATLEVNVLWSRRDTGERHADSFHTAVAA
jgi:hypothetical protein